MNFGALVAGIIRPRSNADDEPDDSMNDNSQSLGRKYGPGGALRLAQPGFACQRREGRRCSASRNAVVETAGLQRPTADATGCGFHPATPPRHARHCRIRRRIQNFLSVCSPLSQARLRCRRSQLPPIGPEPCNWPGTQPNPLRSPLILHSEMLCRRSSIFLFYGPVETTGSSASRQKLAGKEGGNMTETGVESVSGDIFSLRFLN